MERLSHIPLISPREVQILVGKGSEDDPHVDVAVDIYGEEYGTNPLIALSGGPGFSARHGDLVPFANFAHLYQRTVAIVDMPGTGGSMLSGQDLEEGDNGYRDYSHLWTIQQHARWLDEVRQGLQVEKPDIVGNSWGAMLAFEYALVHPKNVRSVVAIGAMESISDYQRDSVRRLLEIHPRSLEIISAYAQGGEAEKAVYQPLLDAIEVSLARRHGLGIGTQQLPESRRNWELQYEQWRRKTPAERSEAGDHSQYLFPEPLIRSGNDFFAYGKKIFDVMVGDGPLAAVFPTGNLRDHERLDALKDLSPEISVFVMVGEHDEMSPRAAQRIADAVPTSRIVVVPGTAHLGFWEKPREYFVPISSHLKSLDNIAD